MSDAGSRAIDEQPKQPESSYVVSPVPTKMAPPDRAESEVTQARLMKFYGVESLGALIEAQAHHIERLQEKLRAAEKPFSFAPQRVREG